MQVPNESWRGADAREVTAVQCWLESAGITGFALALAICVSPEDPVLFGTRFPWLALAPMSVGILHGFMPALASVAAIALVTMKPYLLGYDPQHAKFDTALLAGFLIVALLPAELRDRGARRVTTLARRAQDLACELEALGRSHRILASSHERLERTNALGGASLAATLDRARLRFRREGVPSVADVGQAVLSIFASHGLVQAASVFRCADDRIVPRAIATLGPGGADPTHPLVLAALEGRAIATVREHEPMVSGVRDTSLLAVVPLEDSRGKLWAVVAISDMPFIALRDGHLRMLSDVGGCLADTLRELTASATEATERSGETLVRSRIARCDTLDSTSANDRHHEPEARDGARP